MAKQVLKIEQYQGGLNSNSDPRDIAENELSEATDIMVDEFGKVRMMGGTTSAYRDFTGNITPGYGLFQFSHDRLEGETAGAVALETGDDYLVKADTDTSASISIYSRESNNWVADVISLGSVTGMKPAFYVADGALRVSDGEFSNANDNKWYGYIKRTHFSGVSPGGTADDYDGWYSKDQEMAAPTRGLFGEHVAGETADNGTNSITNLTASVTDSFAGMDTELDVGDYIAVNDSQNVACLVQARVDDENLTTVSLGSGTWGPEDDYIIFPPAGKGFCVDLNNRGGAGGTWEANDYEIATTFIYDGNQESLLFENIGDGDLFAVAANDTIDWTIYCTAPFDPRISGGRVYIRKYDTEDPWILLADISLRDGVRSGLGDTYKAWTLLASITGTAGSVDNVYLQGGLATTMDKNADTYEVLNGISQTENTLIAKFKTAVVTNRMVYIGNVRMINEDNETVTMGDAMIKSPVNKFDTFPLSRIIEASVRDGDEIVKLEEYADRILQFKKNKMHLINISQELEFLEDTFMYKGVSHPSAVCKTDYGIAWVNNLGCYLYNGQKVVDLLEKGGRQIIKESDWNDFTTNAPMIGYLPKKRQLIVVDDNTSTGTGKTFLYDMVTQSWIQGSDATFTSGNLTNFITDFNGDLLHAHTTGTVLKWDDASDSSTDMIMTTKDIDFGHPGVRKKIYKVYLTYKGNATRVEVYYGVDGLDPALTFFTINSDGSTTGGSAAAKCLVSAGTTDWLKAELKPSASINNISSFRLKLKGDGSNPVSSDFEINDISIVFRLKSVK